MYGLILDTASLTSFLILTREGKVVDLFTFSQNTRISTPVLEALSSWQKKYFLSSQNISYLAVGIGPGSFTGSKVGITIGKSFAYAHQIPLLSFCSLISLTPDIMGPFSLISDAKSSGIFVLEGKRDKEGLFFSFPHKTILLEKTPLLLEKNSLWISHVKEDLENKFFFSPPNWEKKEPNYPFLAAYLYEKFQKKENSFSFFSPLSCEKGED